MASLTEWNEFEQAPGDGEGQGSLACCSPQSWKESDATERLNNNSKIYSCCCEVDVQAFFIWQT